MGRKKKCIEYLNDKLVRLHTRRPGHGNAKEISNEKLNLF